MHLLNVGFDTLLSFLGLVFFFWETQQQEKIFLFSLELLSWTGIGHHRPVAIPRTSLWYVMNGS